jgi:Lrp/AsnC family leucine-responsive transcriptional regulator
MKRTASPLSGLAGITGASTEAVELDSLDRRLLVLLARDARLSQRALARELGVSPPAIGDRISRLEEAGVIRGYSVLIDWPLLGYVTCYLAVTAGQSADQGKIMTALQLEPEVEDVLVVTGSVDMFVRIKVRDHAHLRNLLLDRLWQIDGIQHTETFLSLAEAPTKSLAPILVPQDPPRK